MHRASHHCDDWPSARRAGPGTRPSRRRCAASFAAVRVSVRTSTQSNGFVTVSSKRSSLLLQENDRSCCSANASTVPRLSAALGSPAQVTVRRAEAHWSACWETAAPTRLARSVPIRLVQRETGKFASAAQRGVRRVGFMLRSSMPRYAGSSARYGCDPCPSAKRRPRPALDLPPPHNASTSYYPQHKTPALPRPLGFAAVETFKTHGATNRWGGRDVFETSSGAVRDLRRCAVVTVWPKVPRHAPRAGCASARELGLPRSGAAPAHRERGAVSPEIHEIRSGSPPRRAPVPGP